MLHDRNLWKLLPLGLGMALAASCGGGDSAKPGPKHIVLISLDTLRADHLGAYGDARRLTPSIDSIAREGVVFEAVLAPAPTTLASHTSMLTGSYPQTHGVVRNGYPVHPDNVTLPEVLRAEGFHTAAFLGSFALDSRFGLDQGFQLYDEKFDSLVEPGRDQNQRSADAVIEAVLAHMDELGNGPDRTFFFVHLFDAHQPYEPPPTLARRYASDGMTLTFDSKSIEAIVAAKHREWFGIAPEAAHFGLGGSVVHGLDAESVRKANGRAIPEETLPASLYAAEVAAVDLAIAKLLAGLDKHGWLQDTLIVISGDHGETFWEHADLWNHGLWVYNTTIAVPWIMRWPKAPWRAGMRVAQPASTVDLMPTLLGLLELPVPVRSEGTSWLPVLEGKPLERGPIFSVATQPYIEPGQPKDQVWPNARKPHAIRLGAWKYVQSEYNGVEELFFLQNDPGERENLMAKAATDTELQNVLQDLRARLARFRESARPLESRFDPAQSRETASRLQAMGYGQGDKEE